MSPRKTALSAVCASIVLSACSITYAALSHPNFQAADEAIVAAMRRIHDAQSVNGPNFGGHAGRAEQLLRDARDELRMADSY